MEAEHPRDFEERRVRCLGRIFSKHETRQPDGPSIRRSAASTLDRMAHAWHTKRAFKQDMAQPCASRGDRSVLVMMGSGVRVPASAWPVGKALQKGVFLIRRFSRHRITANDGVAVSMACAGGHVSNVGVCRSFSNLGGVARASVGCHAHDLPQDGTRMAHRSALRDASRSCQHSGSRAVSCPLVRR
jgi:hypothetical protein